jgi:hypothetical protein
MPQNHKQVNIIYLREVEKLTNQKLTNQFLFLVSLAGNHSVNAEKNT